jgi:transcriptional regulator with XRE-family HTH domain
MIKCSFGETLRQLRIEKCLSQTALGKMLSVSQDAISVWELDKSEPDYETLRKLAKIFDVSADYLLGLKEYQ